MEFSGGTFSVLLLFGLAAGAFAQVVGTGNESRQTSNEIERPSSVISPHNQQVIGCHQDSMVLVRQALAHELEQINNYNIFWFNDLDKDELNSEQKKLIGNIIMAGGPAASLLLNSDSKPSIEIEASYFRPLNIDSLPLSIVNNRTITYGFNSQTPIDGSNSQPIEIKLGRRSHDKCSYDAATNHFTYKVYMVIGPIEHNLDVIYNLPKELSLLQPVSWRYAQLRVIVTRMIYEVTLKQSNWYKVSHSVCPLEVTDINYISSSPVGPNVAVIGSGLATNNQTVTYLERLFSDYTRPAVLSRLREMFKFNMNSKSFPFFT